MISKACPLLFPSRQKLEKRFGAMAQKTLKRQIDLLEVEAPFGAILGSAGRAVVEAEKNLGLQTIKAPFLSILWLLNAEPGHAQGEYAAALHYDLATFGRHVEALVSEGYVHKAQAEHDHRVMELRLTAKGEAKITEKTRTLKRMDSQVAEAMGAEDFQRLRTLLGRYLRNFERSADAH
jgi:DNA-binding MarR family transcriptional regulator